MPDWPIYVVLEPDKMSLIPFPYKEIFDEQLKSFDLLTFDKSTSRQSESGPPPRAGALP